MVCKNLGINIIQGVAESNWIAELATGWSQVLVCSYDDDGGELLKDHCLHDVERERVVGEVGLMPQSLTFEC